MDIARIKKEDPALDWFRTEMEKYKLQQEDCEAMRKEKKVLIDIEIKIKCLFFYLF